MSQYTIQNPNLKPSKVFILQKSELEKRWDPTWYVYLKSIQGFKHKKVAFKNLLLSNPQYGANEVGIERQTNNEPRYIRITDINEFGELENALGKTASNVEEKYLLQENDLLLARSGNTVGKSYLHKNVDYDCFFAGYMIRFKLDQSKVLPEYVFVYTQTEFYKKWTKAIQRTTGQPNINAEEYRSLEIPLPNKSTQSKIVNIYFDFIAQKQKNEAEAEKLLSSIDDYLLNELGIKLPEPPENTLKNRMFTTSFQKITSERFDPLFWQGSIYAGLEKTTYPFLNIKQVVKYFSTGFAAGHSDQNISGEGIIQIRPTNITENRDFIFNRNIYIDFSKKQDLKNELLVKGEVLFNNTNSQSLVGKTIHFDLDGDYFCSNHITRIGVKDICDEIYLTAILNLYQRHKVFFKTCINWNNQSGVNIDILKRLSIPVPPLARQKEIAEHITSIRQQAQQLKDQTNELLKKASKEIEAILLS